MRVLLVEDEPRIAAFLTKGLHRRGFTVDWVGTGTEALERARKGEPATTDLPDVILLDLGLPDIDGIDVLRALHGATPVIVLTARTHPDDRATALHLGARHYLTKPVSLDDVVGCLCSTDQDL